jgi:hypothetical protein
MPRFTIYENTEANARRVGWAFTPEYCFGDATLPYVKHDHVHGCFYFIATNVGGA